MTKVILLIVAGIVVIGAGFFTWAYADVAKYKKISIGEVNINDLPDGLYKGSFEGGRFTNSVEVTIIDHEIKYIKTISSATKIEELNNQIYDEVIKKQSLNIDTVSGATVSTKTALKAIENALSHK